MIFIDEAQEMSPVVMNELRLLASARFCAAGSLKFLIVNQENLSGIERQRYVAQWLILLYPELSR